MLRLESLNDTYRVIYPGTYFLVYCFLDEQHSLSYPASSYIIAGKDDKIFIIIIKRYFCLFLHKKTFAVGTHKNLLEKAHNCCFS